MAKLKSILLLLLSVNSSFCIAQNSDSPILCVNDSSKVIEKVYLHTDRDYYSPGDDIWFKAYLTEAPDMMLSCHSKNLHVEFISPEYKIIDSRIVRIECGLGNGDFRLPDSLHSGSYLIRAYTNYMRNFRTPQFFVKKIRIIGSSDSGKEVSKNTEYFNNIINIKFFPEGGSLVNDVTSSVGFKATNAFGEGCDVTGEVYSSSGEKVTSFASTHKGMGRFHLRPALGAIYYAVVRDSTGATVRSRIPESFTNGVVLDISDYQCDEPLITIRTNPITLRQLLNRDLSLSISSRKTLFKILTFKITSLFTSFRLPAGDLPSGILQLTLSGQNELPLCERLIYYNAKDVNLNIRTDKPTYKKHDSVSVSIKLIGDTLLVDRAFLSLSAAEEICLNNDSQLHTTISSWFLLESDIQGPVEDPSYYFDVRNTDRFEDLDLLLLTQGWRDFEWKYSNPEYAAENGFSISGRVERLFSRNPLKNSSVTAIFMLNGDEILLTSPADSSGAFHFEEFDFTGKGRVIVSATGKKEKLQGKLILNNSDYIPEKVQMDESEIKLIKKGDHINEFNRIWLEQEYEIKSSLKRKYTLSDTIILDEVEIISRQKKETRINYAIQRVAVGIPSNVIEMTPVLQKQIDIRDIIRNRVAGLSFVPTGDVENSGLRFRGSSFEPLFMLDGTIVTYGIVASLPLTWIDRIEILKPPGSATTMMNQEENDEMFHYAGVVSVITKPLEERSAEVKPAQHSVNRIITGFDAPRIFYSPDNSTVSDNMPDLRSTLYWVPNIEYFNGEDLHLHYFNADNTGTIIIIAEGITSSGIPVTGRTEYVIE
jgi:hypothetical protein